MEICEAEDGITAVEMFQGFTGPAIGASIRSS